MKRFALIAFLLATPALAHDAPSGWSYDAYCCGGHDCGPVIRYEYTHPKDGSLSMLRLTIRNGMNQELTGQVSANLEGTEVKVSPDADMHACIYPIGSEHIRCLYMPPNM